MHVTNQKKLQVFISSTYLDLIEERQAAVEAILKAGHIPAGMELFTASNKSQWDIITRWIDESDIYMLILGGRYGSIENESQKSYTHLEYEYAQSQGKPLFAVVIEDSALDSRKSRDIEKDNPERLNEFRKKVLSYMSSFFTDKKDIKLAVHESMGQITQDYDLTGWIRGNQQNSDIAKEMVTLNDELRKLREENEKLKSEQVERSPKLELSINDDQSLEFKLDSNESRFYKKREPIQNIPHHLVDYLTEESIADYNQSLLKITESDINAYNNIQSQISTLDILRDQLKIVLSNTGNIKAHNIHVSITFPDLVLVTDNEKEISDLKKNLTKDLAQIIPMATYNPISIAEKKLIEDKKKAEANSKDIFDRLLNLNGSSPASFLSARQNDDFLAKSFSDPLNYSYIEKNEIIIKLSTLTHSFGHNYNKYFLVPLKKGSSTIQVTLFCDEYLERNVQEIQLTID